MNRIALFVSSSSRSSYAFSSCLPLISARFFSSTKERLGFIGLGAMGGHQAANLIKKGYDLIVYDLDSSSVNRLVELGAKKANSPKEIASQVQVLVTMLPSSEHVKEVYEGSSGIFQGSKPGSLYLDSSTIDPLVARSVATEANKHNTILLDCPVSGGVMGAEAGTLTFMVGGKNEDFLKAKPYLQCMGKNIIHCGDVGAGQATKVCNNLILGISMLGVSEAMNLGVKLGVDPKVLAGVINTSSGRCWTSEVYNPCPGVMPGVPSSRGYTGGFQSRLMKKDLSLAVGAARSQGVPLPIGNIAWMSYDDLCIRNSNGEIESSSSSDQGSNQSKKEGEFSKKDFSSYYDLLQHIKKPYQLEKALISALQNFISKK